MENSRKHSPVIKQLKERFSLHASPEVERAARRTEGRTGKVVPNEPNALIENYFARFDEILSRAESESRERGIAAAKRVLLDAIVIRPEQIPEAYFRHQNEVARQQGMAGEYEGLSAMRRGELRAEESRVVVMDARASLEQWIDFLASPALKETPMEIRYWILRNVAGLKPYNKDSGTFPKRRSHDTFPYPELNTNALEYVIAQLEKERRGHPYTVGYDELSHDRSSFRNAMHELDFPALYAVATRMNPFVPERLRSVKDGAWTNFPMGSSGEALSKALVGKGTGWCIAGSETAGKMLSLGDVNIFWSNDEAGVPTYPRLALRERDKVVLEIRGVASDQHIEDGFEDVLEKKLDTFPDREESMAPLRDSRRMRALAERAHSGGEFSEDDLAFLYETDREIESFGRNSDPRIAELREMMEKNGHVRRVLHRIFHCRSEELALTPSEISKTTKVYYGPLFPDLFVRNPELRAFREDRSEYSRNRLVVPADSSRVSTQLHALLRNERMRLPRSDTDVQENHTLIRSAKSFLSNVLADENFISLLKSERMVIPRVPHAIDAVHVRLSDLGLARDASLRDVCERARSFGLITMPSDFAPAYVETALMDYDEDQEDSFAWNLVDDVWYAPLIIPFVSRHDATREHGIPLRISHDEYGYSLGVPREIHGRTPQDGYVFLVSQPIRLRSKAHTEEQLVGIQEGYERNSVRVGGKVKAKK